MLHKIWFHKRGNFKPIIYPVSWEGWTFSVLSGAVLYGIVWLAGKATTVSGVIASIVIPVSVLMYTISLVMKNKTEYRARL